MFGSSGDCVGEGIAYGEDAIGGWQQWGDLLTGAKCMGKCIFIGSL